MNRFHERFFLRAWILHRERSNRRLHLFAGVATWLGLTTALSALPSPIRIPLLGANFGAAFAVASALYWMFADVLVAGLVLATTALWAVIPWVPWGAHHGALAGAVAPLATCAIATTVAHYGHVYWHERGDFLKGDPPLRSAMDAAHEWLFAPFHHGLAELLHAGWRPSLRERVERSERRALGTRLAVPWSNWARLASCKARFVSAPATVEELTEVVRAAHERGARVRLVASGFSWSSLVPCDDTLVFCERLDRVEVDLADPERPAVWVEAGVTNRRLNDELARHGLAMPWNVVLENVRIAGLAATGTHGTGRATSTVGDLVEAFEIVDARGRRRTLSEATVGPETMSAARLGLGLFGVIARMKLSVVPLYRVRQTDSRKPSGAVLDALPELVRAHDSVELYWFPFNRDVWIRTIDRTGEPRTFHGHGFWFKTANFLQNVWIIATSKLVSRFAPSLTPRLLRFSMRMLPFRTRVLDLPESHHYHHWIELMPAGCMEVGFKVDPELRHVRDAWKTAERLVDEYAARGLHPLNLSLNVRFIGSSGALLTPAYGEGLTCYIEIMWMGRPRAWRTFTSELCREWLKIPGALPHWSKEFEHVEDVVALVRKNLGGRLDRFLELLARSDVDPDRTFFNPMLSRVLLGDGEEG